MKYVFGVILFLLGVASIATWLTEPTNQRPAIRLAIDSTEIDGAYCVSEINVK